MTMTTTDDITEGCQTRENSVIEPHARRSSRFRLRDFCIYAKAHKVQSRLDTKLDILNLVLKELGIHKANYNYIDYIDGGFFLVCYNRIVHSLKEEAALITGAEPYLIDFIFSIYHFTNHK